MTPNAIQKEPGNIQIGIMVLSVCLSVLVTAILGPSLPKMQAHFASVPRAMELVPLTMTIPLLIMTFFCFFAGLISDKIGRKWLLAGAAFVYGVIGTAPLYLQDLYAILGSRALLGFAEAFVMVTGAALIGDFFTGEKRARIMTMQMTAASVSAALLNNVGGLLGDIGWRAPYTIYSVGFLLAIFAAIFLSEPEKRLSGAERAAAEPDTASKNGDEVPVRPWVIAGMCALSVYIGLIFLTVIVNFSYLFDDIGVTSTKQIGMAYGLNSVGVISGNILFGLLLVGRTNASRQMFIGFAVMAVGFFGMSNSTTYTMLTASGIFAGLGSGMALPALLVWTMNLFPTRIRGTGLGMGLSCQFFGNFLAGVVVVLIASKVGGKAAAMGVLGVSLVVAAIAALIVSLRVKKPSPAAAGAV